VVADDSALAQALCLFFKPISPPEAPFPTISVSRTGYVALTPFDANKTSSLTAFIDWLVAEGERRQ
jgi:hypothetical protein